MANEQILSTPTIVEDDGWTLASGSTDAPSADQLKATLRAEPTDEVEPPAPPPPPPRRPVVDEPPDETEPLDEPPVEDEPPAEEPPPARRRTTHDPQRRIDQIHAQLASEREKSERLAAELATLRQAPPPAPAEAPPPPRPVWAGENGFEAQGKSWEEYEEASRQWTDQELDRRLEARFTKEREASQKHVQAERQQAAQQAAHRAFTQRVNGLRQQRPDYDTVIENLGELNSDQLKELIFFSPHGPSIGLHLAEHVDEAKQLVDMEFTRPVMDALHRSTVPAQLLSHFAQHPAEAESIMRMDPVTAIKAIGRLEARLDVDPSVTTAAASSVTRAKPPLRTVGGGAPTVTRPPVSSADDLAFSEDYVLLKNREDARAAERRRGY